MEKIQYKNNNYEEKIFKTMKEKGSNSSYNVR